MVSAIRGGLLRVDDACDQYRLTLEELTGWQPAVERHGLAGLRVTKVQEYRDLLEETVADYYGLSAT